MNSVTHYDRGDGLPCCGSTGKSPQVTKQVTKVTCKKCRLAKYYQDGTMAATERKHEETNAKRMGKHIPSMDQPAD